MQNSCLTIKNLFKKYDTGLLALKDINIEVRQGDFFALLGPNGAGKSTILGIISSLVKKTSGDVTVFGINIEKDFPSIKKNIGVVPQEINFNNFEKIFDIIKTQGGYFGLSSAVSRDRAEKYLKLLNLWDKRDQTPRMLSGGMKRRLMIARALIHEPKLLILDEPTAGVDIELRRSMWEFLKKINDNGTTIILTTHYLEEAESLCRNIAIIDRGEIVQNTSTRNLLRQLNTESFIFNTREKITELPPMEGYKALIVDSNSLEVEVEKNKSLNTLFASFSNAGIEISSMRNKTNRLEELFLSLVQSNTQDFKESSVES